MQKKCAHENLTRHDELQTQWMKEDSEAHKALKSVMLDKHLHNDIKYLTNVVNTTSVEVFNNVLLKYLPKQYHFEFEHMELGAYLAALDTNANVNRKQAVLNTSGTERFKIAWRKSTKKEWLVLFMSPRVIIISKRAFGLYIKGQNLRRRKNRLIIIISKRAFGRYIKGQNLRRRKNRLRNVLWRQKI